MDPATSAPDEVDANYIHVTDLTFTFPNHITGLQNVSLALPPQSRTLLVGANGAGKTTLLRLLSGKRLAPSNTISINGLDPFKESLDGVAYLGLEWLSSPFVATDIGVQELLRSVGGDHFPERRDQLISLLDIDLDWRMHAVSDGERRRVQLAMGLVRPWKILLLDEITVDLDLLSRSNFLNYLKQETQSRECTIVYATHVLDNMADWPTHLVHISLGKIKEWGPIDSFDIKGVRETGNSKLGEVVLAWLREDLKERGPRKNGISSEWTSYKNPGIGGYGAEKFDPNF
ncbi:BgTH12-07915 [Blumeria graminis f. sp. triticale]|uniref:Bgt-1427 n=3 Tax=Blumeria graminis TaxID=34373 RepID=A0A381LA97_BLUGR|nr:hypothetical protein BGT96224_1427 [Blumeria graminis f. sp. tritici 96224]CAD6501786.1 BgTH12-07915 [Blumeria graminis f. sp. triticale]VDB84433.1 Bgt-1427 [Blumeria graminis f. sp. tritici]